MEFDEIREHAAIMCLTRDFIFDQSANLSPIINSTFIVYIEMVYQERPTSSVYSDCFELEELVSTLSNEADAQEIYAIEALENERDTLYREVEARRAIWNSIYQMLIESADVASKITALCKFAYDHIEKEKNKWLANRNAI